MSIQKGQNAYFHPSVRRVVEISSYAKQITLYDSRYYQRDKELFYPSVTYVLSYFPKNKFFETWMKDVGHNADIIMRKAGDEGTQVHNAIERILAGEEVRWIEESGSVNYSTEVWKMIVKFVDFWQTHKPTLLASECHLFSDQYKFAGTGDIVCKINDETWLIDIKTSNSLHRSYDLQTSAYAVAWNETHNVEIQRRGILWLKSSKRGPDKQNKRIQGDGWELKESGNTVEEDFELFKLAYKLFELENPDLVPATELLPNIIKLEN